MHPKSNWNEQSQNDCVTSAGQGYNLGKQDRRIECGGTKTVLESMESMEVDPTARHSTVELFPTFSDCLLEYSTVVSADTCKFRIK